MSRVSRTNPCILFPAMAVIVILGTLVASELLLRVSQQVSVESIHTASEDQFQKIPGAFDPLQDLVEKPHPKLVHHVSINSLGYRGPEISRRKQKGTVRVLCLGDSGTYGHYVNEEETFPHYLQERFRQAGFPVEVINAGVPDTTIIDHLYYLDRSLEIQPDIVVLTFSENDITDLAKDIPTYVTLERNRTLKSSSIIGPIYALVRDTALFNFALKVRAMIQQVTPRSAPTIDLSHSMRQESADESSWVRYGASLKEMKQKLDSLGILLVFNAFPSHFRIPPDGGEKNSLEGQLPRVESLARNLGIQTVNLLTPFLDSHLTKNDMYLLPYDGHSGRRGYQIQADTIFENIKVYVQRVVSRGATEGRP